MIRRLINHIKAMWELSRYPRWEKIKNHEERVVKFLGHHGIGNAIFISSMIGLSKDRTLEILRTLDNNGVISKCAVQPVDDEYWITYEL